MKINTVRFLLYSPSGNAKAVQAISGRYATEADSVQLVTYTIIDSVATLVNNEAVFGTRLTLPLDFTVPVDDLGSGEINTIKIDVDTMKPQTAICPKPATVERRYQKYAPSIQQTLMADYIGLL